MLTFEHGAASKLSSRIPYSVLVPLFIIVAIGILNLSSAAQASRPDLYLNQLGRFGFALILMISAAMIHTRIIRRIAFLSYVVAITLLVMVLVVGHTAKGAERWLVLGAFRLQPSDPAKLALILAMARYCSLNFPYKGYTIISLLRPFNISRPLAFLALVVLLLIKSRHEPLIFSNQLLTSKLGMALMGCLFLFGFFWLLLSLIKLRESRFELAAFIAPIDVPLVPFLLVAIEPDLGTGLIILGLAAIMLLYIGINKTSLLIGVVSAVGVSVLAYFTVLMDYQKQRIISFLNPEADLKGEGYHAIQSIIAIGSGRVTGKGYNGGTQTQLSFLPENATDFVFSVWAEEWGFVASVFLLMLYLILLWSILKLASKTDDHFSQLICVGVAANIFLHVFVNVGMVTGLLPVVGVPLPLMSYGGSSLTVTLIGLGLVTNVAVWRGEN